MEPKEKLNELIRFYSRINSFPEKYKDILKIDKPMRWILADENKQYVSAYKDNNSKIIDIDITSCFPTICRFLFSDSNPDFVAKINNQETKLEKNILISNTLKNTEYLKILNIISKMIILGFIFDRQDSDKIILLEFEKDGCLIFIDDFFDFNLYDTLFLNYIKNNDFKFKFKEYNYYIRCNNTSWFWSDEDQFLRIKGLYKHVPDGVLKFYRNVFSGHENNINNIISLYNKKTFDIIRKNYLDQFLEEYYFCDKNKKVLTSSSKYEIYNSKIKIDPDNYIKTFIYPIWFFYKRNVNNLFS